MVHHSFDKSTQELSRSCVCILQCGPSAVSCVLSAVLACRDCALCCVLCPVSCVLCPVSCVMCPVSCVLCPAVCLSCVHYAFWGKKREVNSKEGVMEPPQVSSRLEQFGGSEDLRELDVNSLAR